MGDVAQRGAELWVQGPIRKVFGNRDIVVVFGENEVVGVGNVLLAAYSLEFFYKVDSVGLPRWAFTNAMYCGFWDIEVAKGAIRGRVS
jgi:hypothetical protein